jgi:hypothetical protein
MDRVAQAAADVLAVQLHLAAQGRTLAGAALAGAREFVEWAHHPRDDHVDRTSGVRFYYHAHAADERVPGEHGHFHLFVPVPGEPAAISHLIAISLDDKGLPLRLFTTNHWVTGDTWLDADALIALLPGVSVRAAGRLAPVARWLTAMVTLYQDTIVALLRARDRRLHGDAAALENRSLHIVSERRICLPERLARVKALRHSPKEETHVAAV